MSRDREYPRDTLPLVSAIALCYNHSKYVFECLDSIKNQSYSNIEVIIIDDGSNDGSVFKIQSWLEINRRDWKFIKHNISLGICRSLNEGLRMAKGKYVGMIATDDLWEPDKIDRQVKIMEGLDERVGVIYSDAYQIDENGMLLPKYFIEAHRQLQMKPEGDIHAILWQGNFIPAMTTLIRHSCFAKVGYYDESLFYEDWDMWLRLSKEFYFAFDKRISARYRIVSSSLMRSSFKAIIDSEIKIFEKWLNGDKLSEKIRNEIVKRLETRSLYSYRLGTKNNCRNLWIAFKLKRSLILFCSFILSLLGIRYNKYERYLKKIKNIIGR